MKKRKILSFFGRLFRKSIKKTDNQESLVKRNKAKNVAVVVRDKTHDNTCTTVAEKEKQENINFVAIDFETANSTRTSVCAVGIAVVNSGRIINNKSWLVRPNRLIFNRHNVKVHGIEKHHVAEKPKFDQIWEELLPYLDSEILLAHNASFDMGVLAQTLAFYKLPFPNVEYLCSLELSKRVWELENYRLKTLASYLALDLCHHDPLSDSKVCAQIAIEACRSKSAISVNHLSEITGTTPLSLHSQTPSSAKKTKKTTKRKTYPPRINELQIVPEVQHISTSHPFYNKSFVFTGDFTSLSRRQAAQKVINVGGKCSDYLNQQVDYLVVGKQNVKLIKDKVGKKSTKMIKAEKMIEKGNPLKIISEEEFLQMIGKVS